MNRVAASLAPQDTDNCLRELDRLAPRIGLAEVRLDLMRAFNVSKLVTDSPVPLILTCRPERERGGFTAEDPTFPLSSRRGPIHDRDAGRHSRPASHDDGQSPAWTPSAPPWPGRMSRPISAPRATAAATRKAVCIPLANVAWLMSVITRATLDQAPDQESPKDLAAAFGAYADAVIPALAGHWT